MTEKEFILTTYNLSNATNGNITWKTPSNIALVKYWGKQEPQIPENTSISFTLDACFTLTKLEYKLKESKAENVQGSNSKMLKQGQHDGSKFNFDIYFEGEKKDDFKPKIELFFERIERYVPFIREFAFEISSKNSFPHSSGIASSASGLSALALCIMSLERKLNPTISEAYFNKKASFLARLGSGSACRSIEGELIVWGEHPKIERSSNLFGVKFPYTIHENFICELCACWYTKNSVVFISPDQFSFFNI